MTRLSPRVLDSMELVDEGIVTALSVPTASTGRVYTAVKRAMDVTIAGGLLVFLLPLLGACALLIRLDSPGPILFRQERAGRGARRFHMLKFRSMRSDADPALHREYVASFIRGDGESYEAGNTRLYKVVADPRITRVGKWLRQTSIDELPQLWNVLRGEMSLVGPRPPIIYELEHYEPRHYERLAVQPGITGLWQVSGRSTTTFERMVELDLEYIRTRSLVRDLEILARTIPVVLFDQNAR